MKIRFLIGFAGSDFAYHRGDVVDLQDAEAKNLIAAGFAEAVEKSEKTETTPQRQRKLERAVSIE